MRVLHGRPIAVTGSRDGTVRVWDVQRGRAVRCLRGHGGSVRCLDVNGKRAVSGSYDMTCRVSFSSFWWTVKLMFVDSSCGTLIRESVYTTCEAIFRRYTLSHLMVYVSLPEVSILPSASGTPRLGKLSISSHLPKHTNLPSIQTMHRPPARPHRPRLPTPTLPLTLTTRHRGV